MLVVVGSTGRTLANSECRDLQDRARMWDPIRSVLPKMARVSPHADRPGAARAVSKI